MVEFDGGNRVNYLRELYGGATKGSEATRVPVSVSTVSGGTDQALLPGAQITGQVADVSNGAALAGVWVCALQPAPGEIEDCDHADAAGDYALRSLPAGTYTVGFGVEHTPVAGYLVAGQWWQGAATISEATPITLTPPALATGIDGQVESWEGTEDPPVVPIVIGGPSTEPAAGAPRKAPQRVYVDSEIAGGELKFRPRQIGPFEHGTLSFSGLTYGSYGGAVAHAGGRARVLGCVAGAAPRRCSYAKTYRPKVELRLGNLIECRGRSIYSELRYRLQGRLPAGVGRQGIESLKPVGRRGC